LLAGITARRREGEEGRGGKIRRSKRRKKTGCRNRKKRRMRIRKKEGDKRRLGISTGDEGKLKGQNGRGIDEENGGQRA
jgi:hypothetical protein